MIKHNNGTHLILPLTLLSGNEFSDPVYELAYAVVELSEALKNTVTNYSKLIAGSSDINSMEVSSSCEMFFLGDSKESLTSEYLASTSILELSYGKNFERSECERIIVTGEGFRVGASQKYQGWSGFCQSKLIPLDAFGQ